MGHVIAEIWRYPVKSMQGERLTNAVVGDLGVEFDRGWGVRELATGTVLTGRREPKLLLASATVDDGEVRVRTDKGAVIGGTLNTMSDALSAWLGYRVRLERAGDSGGTYESPVDPGTEQDWVSWTGPAGAWHDSARTRLSLLSVASCGDIDPRRFRANVLLASGAEPVGTVGGEHTWLGERLRIGRHVLVDVRKRINRCVMVARPTADLPGDLGALKRVIREHDNQMGVGALVIEGGTISVGDDCRTVSA